MSNNGSDRRGSDETKRRSGDEAAHADALSGESLGSVSLGLAAVALLVSVAVALGSSVIEPMVASFRNGDGLLAGLFCFLLVVGLTAMVTVARVVWKFQRREAVRVRERAVAAAAAAAADAQMRAEALKSLQAIQAAVEKQALIADQRG